MKKINTLLLICLVPFFTFAQLQQTRVSKNKTKTVWESEILQRTIEASNNVTGNNIKQEKTTKGVENEMINIPLDYDGEAGIFMMGKEGATSNVFEVTLTYNYDMSKYMITNAMYAEMLNYAHVEGLLAGDYETSHTTVTNAEGVQFEILDLDGDFEVTCQIEFADGEFKVLDGLEDYPVYYVSWYGAAFYCNMQSLQNELTELYNQTTAPWERTFYGEDGYRIPTEHEWEYAATYNDERDYPWGNEVATSDYCNFVESGIEESTPVNEYPLGASNLGLMDMAGNLTEITNNYIFSYSTEPETNPTGPENDGDEHRIAIKGNTFEADAEVIKCHWRSGWTRQWYPSNNASFRIVRVYAGEIPSNINQPEKDNFRINNFPNPANSYTTFCFSLKENSEVQIIIYDINGKQIDKINRNATQGRNAFQYNTQNISNGIYFYNLTQGENIYTNKLIIKH